jgi:ABC-2 type transport system ATP-binding protein
MGTPQLSTTSASVERVEPASTERASRATAPVIELRGLSVRLGKREVLRDLTCSFSGRTIGLLGPNGAGKSTLINTLLGFWPVAAGSAHVFGADIRKDARKIRALIGYMPENDAFISKMTAVAFIRLMAELSGLPSEMALERAHEALFYVGLGEARYRKLGTYSLGMKQLAKLAQAIAHGPKLLILDEPTNGLDPPARQRMIRLVREMRDSGKMHIVLCSHLLRDVEETCEEVVILKNGRVVHYSNLEDERRLNRRFLEIELQGETERFMAAVETTGSECAPGPLNRLKIVLAENVEIRDIYRIAAEQSIQIRRLNFRRDTLEDIFLKAMENNDGRL